MTNEMKELLGTDNLLPHGTSNSKAPTVEVILEFLKSGKAANFSFLESWGHTRYSIAMKNDGDFFVETLGSGYTYDEKELRSFIDNEGITPDDWSFTN